MGKNKPDKAFQTNVIFESKTTLVQLLVLLSIFLLGRQKYKPSSLFYLTVSEEVYNNDYSSIINIYF